MALKIDVLGFRYDDAEPSFIDTGAKYWLHRPTNKLYDKAEFAKFLTAKGVAMGAKESGTLSAGYLANHLGIPVAPAGGGGGIVGAPITATVAGTGTDTATITFAGGPAAANGSVTLAATLGGEAITGIGPVVIAKNDTPTAVAAKVAAALDGKQDAGTTVEVDAVAAAAVVTVTEAGGGHVDALTATVA